MLSGQVKIWPTPTVNGNNQRPDCGPKAGLGLATAAKMWSIPAANDAKNSTFPRSQITRDTLIGDMMRLFATPNASHAQGTSGGGQRTDLRTDAGGQLNPTWVEWLMGFPLGWTDLSA